MPKEKYLPSKQFSTIVGAITLSLLLILIASYVTQPHIDAKKLIAAPAYTGDWAATLNDIQAQESAKLPDAPDESTVDSLRQSVQSDNVTQSVAKTMLINLANAKLQGLGDDTPTQDKIIADAVSQVTINSPKKPYTKSDLTVVDDSQDSHRAYGNALARIIIAHTKPDYANTLVALDDATTNNDPSRLNTLKQIASDYDNLTKDLLQIPVPRSIVPFHLQIVINFQNITNSYTAMKDLLADPLRGLAGVQTYKSLTDQTGQLFINIAQSLHKDGILFTKDEPGYIWSGLLSPQ